MTVSKTSKIVTSMMNSLLKFVFLTTAILGCIISSNKAEQLECTSCSDSTINHNNITCYFGGCHNAQINCINSSSDCYLQCQHRGCEGATIYFSESSTHTAHLLCGSLGCAFTSITSYRHSPSHHMTLTPVHHPVTLLDQM